MMFDWRPISKQQTNNNNTHNDYLNLKTGFGGAQGDFSRGQGGFEGSQGGFDGGLGVYGGIQDGFKVLREDLEGLKEDLKERRVLQVPRVDLGARKISLRTSSLVIRFMLHHCKYNSSSINQNHHFYKIIHDSIISYFLS